MGIIRLEELADKVRDIPPLPMVAARVMELTEDPDATVLSIEREILKDQGLSARILRLANSAYYGMSRRVGTVSEAVVILGLKTLKSVVLAASVSPVMLRPLIGYGLEREGLWKNSQLCAVTARLIAKTIRYPNIEQAYIAGLLRDIGKVILDLYMREEYQWIVDTVQKSRQSFHQAEAELLGYHHGQVGQKIAERWMLPAELSEAIALHHNPEAAVLNPRLTAVVHSADALVMTMGVHLGVDGLAYEISPHALDLLGLDDRTLQNLLSMAADLYLQIDSVP